LTLKAGLDFAYTDIDHNRTFNDIDHRRTLIKLNVELLTKNRYLDNMNSEINIQILKLGHFT